MKLCIETGLFMRMDYRETIREIAKTGCKNVELNPDVFPAGSIKKEQIKEVKMLLEDNGLHPAAVLPLYSIASPDETVRKDALEKWLRSIDAAKTIGAEMLTTEMTGDPKLHDEAKNSFSRSLDVILPRLEDADFYLNFECHPGDFIENHYDAVDFIKQINHPRFGYIYSIAHTYIMSNGETDIDKMISHGDKSIKHVHCADGFKAFRYIAQPEWRCHMHLIPGLGEIDIQHSLRCLNAIGYNGYISLNLFAHVDHPTSTVMVARDRIKDYCDEIGINLEI